MSSILPADEMYVPDDGRRAHGGLSDVGTCGLEVEVVSIGIDMMTGPRNMFARRKKTN